ncbi:MAG: peptide-methionine (R)-S-oxide reductase MsrB [Burkholderiales bacterium]
MQRRTLLAILAGAPLLGARARAATPDKEIGVKQPQQDWKALTDAEWRARLTPAQYDVLRREGTEAAGSSPLNAEKRPGTYVCAGCGLALFGSEMKYESGTGWPSFFTHLPEAFQTKRDFRLIWPRTEYHCARCGGHQGHVFDDGPQPTGQRWCNNGVALAFLPKAP